MFLNFLPKKILTTTKKNKPITLSPPIRAKLFDEEFTQLETIKSEALIVAIPCCKFRKNYNLHDQVAKLDKIALNAVILLISVSSLFLNGIFTDFEEI